MSATITNNNTTNIVKMPRHQCPCPSCAEARNVRHEPTRYYTVAQIHAHLVGKWSDSEITEYMRRLEGKGTIQVGDCVIVKEPVGQLVAGGYSEVSEVDEEAGRVRLFNVWPCSNRQCWGESHRKHERVDHGWTEITNVELFMPPPEPNPPANAASGRIRARRITLIRSESDEHETAIFAMPNVAAMWEAADEKLKEWARSSDATFIFAETVLFKIEFENGELYEGEFYIFHPDTGSDRGFTLADHIRDFCASFGGLQMPEEQGEFIYDNNINLDRASAESRASMLQRFELGRESEPTIWTAPDGEGGRNFYTMNGTKRVQEWFRSARHSSRRWRCRRVASLPLDAQQTTETPADVRTAIAAIFPQVRAV